MSRHEYVAVVYFVSYATRELGVSLTTMLALLVCSGVAFAASLVVFARSSDRWGAAGLYLRASRH